MAEFTITLTFKERPPRTFGGGFNQGWFSLKDDAGNGMEVASGAGLGNPIMSLIKVEKGKRTYYDCNLTKETKQMLKGLGLE